MRGLIQPHRRQRGRDIGNCPCDPLYFFGVCGPQVAVAARGYPTQVGQRFVRLLLNVPNGFYFSVHHVVVKMCCLSLVGGG